MKRAGVVGWPIEHSRSPIIHGHWIKQHGLAASYTRLPVRPEAIEAFFSDLAGQGLVGCNVTMPHKEAAFRAAAVVEEPARMAKAANTLWLQDGRLHATNSDIYGFIASLKAGAPQWQARGRPIAVIGAGGAARAVIVGLLAEGAGEIRVFNRTRARAETLGQELDASRVLACDMGDLDAGLEGVSLVVNTSSLGMKGHDSLEIDLARAPAAAVVADIVYTPLETPLLKSARARGLVAVDGLGMLLHQAVPGFERWFGVRPTVTGELWRLVAADVEGRK